MSGWHYNLPLGIKFLVSLPRPEEVIWTRTPGKRSISGAGSSVTVSPSRGHPSCWGMCSVIANFHLKWMLSKRLGGLLEQNKEVTEERGWQNEDNNRWKRYKNRNHQVEITLKCHWKVSYYLRDTSWNCLELWTTDSRTEWFDGCACSFTVCSRWLKAVLNKNFLCLFGTFC